MKALKTQLNRIFVNRIAKANTCQLENEIDRLTRAKGLTIKTKYELLIEVILKTRGL
jgi:hypothetical protein